MHTLQYIKGIVHIILLLPTPHKADERIFIFQRGIQKPKEEKEFVLALTAGKCISGQRRLVLRLWGFYFSIQKAAHS